MPAFRLTVVIGLGVLSLALSVRCWAQEPSDGETIEDLRREVAELRSAVRDLNRQLAEVEYQQIPKVVESPKQPAAEPHRSVIDLYDPQRDAGYHQLPRIVDARNRPRHAPRLESAPLPKNLRFPINIERGSGMPIRPKATRDLWPE
jgi:hypothetical protein